MTFNHHPDAEIQALQIKFLCPIDLQLENADMARHIALSAIVRKLAYLLADAAMNVTKTVTGTEYALNVYVLTPAQLEKLINERVKA